MSIRLFFCVSLAAVSLAMVQAGPPAAPPPPAGYDVIIRYRIDAARTERLVQFAAMTRYLDSIGFKKDPSENENEAEDRTATEMTGHIAAANVRKILREPHIHTVMLFPKGSKMPEGNQLVRVDLELTADLKEALQQKLFNQTRGVLRDIGFQEAVGYDQRGDTRIVGNIAGKSLLTLLSDLRATPAGANIGAPFQSVTPIRLVDVMLGMEPIKPLPSQPTLAGNQAKIGPDLRKRLADKEAGGKALRLDVILWTTPTIADRSWQVLLRRAAPGLVIEGQLGPLVAVQAPANRIVALADLSIVSAVRLPIAARPLRALDTQGAVIQGLNPGPLRQLANLRRGTRIAIIDGDFQGYQEQIKANRLPAATRFVDLTAERSIEMSPDPAPKSAGPGQGTRLALAAAKAAPQAALVLIRVDAAAPYMVQEAARFINGEVFDPPSLDQRASELAAENSVLNDRREQLVTERKALLEGSLPFEEFQTKWAAHKAKRESFDRDERAYDQHTRRYLDLRDALRGLKGVQAVVSALTWPEGHPLGGNGPLDRYFDDRPTRKALWIQAAGDTSRQTWSGLFRDIDGNGVMEFTAPDTSLPKDAWTREVRFLGWQDGGASADLPAGAKLRITLQWREAHDPDFFNHGEDVYQQPLAELRLLLVRQRDPSGKKLPADDFEVVAQSEKLPQRIDNQANAATYEHGLEYTVPVAGRYAIMILGQAPRSTRPADQITLPSQERVGELRPRVFVDTLAGKGKAVLGPHAASTVLK